MTPTARTPEDTGATNRMRITVKAELKLPKPPNYLKIVGTETTMDIGELSKDDAEAVSRCLRGQFMDNWTTRSTRPVAAIGK